MSFRIYKQHTREEATEELLDILATKGPTRTSDLRGTDKFHGTRTLSNRQITRLLRDSGKCWESAGGAGMRTFTVWHLKAA